MPELPDVEHFKKYFEKHCLNKKVVGVSSSTKSLIKKASFSEFEKEVKRRKLQKPFLF